jgi:FkbM family methyltransferase
MQRVRGHLAEDHRLLTVTAKDGAYPLVCRANTSDVAVFWQIFIRCDYSCANDLTDVGLVIDCGANAGYSPAYFLSRFPACHVIAIEPDPETFVVLRRNMAPYGGRVQALNSAVWSRAAGLKLLDTYSDGRAWTRQGRGATPEETPDVHAVDIGSLVRESCFDRISMLKVDIEGAEAAVFADAPWMDLVDNIVIELHDDTSFGNATSVLNAAIRSQDFVVHRMGERTICRRK